MLLLEWFSLFLGLNNSLSESKVSVKAFHSHWFLVLCFKEVVTASGSWLPVFHCNHFELVFCGAAGLVDEQEHEAGARA